MVITEILYDQPGAGNDSLEFVELYNNTPFPIDLNGSVFTLGFAHTFTAPTIVQPGGYVTLARFAGFFANVFGFTPIQWNTGALINTGEPIVLRDAQGILVDSVDYRPGGAWPAGTANTGVSLTLCDPNSDNSLGANWRASLPGTGVFINGSEIKATPGTADNLTCAPSPEIQFVAGTYSFNEAAGQATVEVQLNAAYPLALQCAVALGTGGTATDGSDFTFGAPQTVQFPANSNAPIQITFPIIDDLATEGDETLLLVLQNAVAPAIFGAVDTAVVTIVDNEAPLNPLLSFAQAVASFNESAGTVSVTVNLIAPNANATLIGPGTLPTPIVTTIADMVANAATLQGQLVTIQGVTITPAAGTTVFSGTATIADATGASTLYTRPQANFSANTVPAAPVQLTGHISSFNNVPQIVMRNASDVQ